MIVGYWLSVVGGRWSVGNIEDFKPSGYRKNIETQKGTECAEVDSR